MVQWLSYPAACGIFPDQDKTHVSFIGRGFFTTETPGKPYDQDLFLSLTQTVQCAIKGTEHSKFRILGKKTIHEYPLLSNIYILISIYICVYIYFYFYFYLI